MKYYNLPITVSWDEDTFIAICPAIQGAFAEGDTPQQAISELVHVIEMIDDYKHDAKIEQSYSITTSEEIHTQFPVALA